jgi:hypothetical protein
VDIIRGDLKKFTWKEPAKKNNSINPRLTISAKYYIYAYPNGIGL